MLNIFQELWRAQQSNKRIISGLHFPDTFIVSQHGQFEWYFVSKSTPSKILKKKQTNTSPQTITEYLSSFGAVFPVATCSRISSHPPSPNIHPLSISIEHLSSEQVTSFLLTDKQQDFALPSESLFLQRFIHESHATMPNSTDDLHNHFIKVIYNANFLRMEKRRNAFIWENLPAESHSNQPNKFDRYNCTLSYEGPEEFTIIEKLNPRTAESLKQLTKDICSQLETIHEQERGKVKQISLIFKKAVHSDRIDLLHCNEIAFEREQHIPELWRMSFSLPFMMPLHVTSDVTSIIALAKEEKQMKKIPCCACGEIIINRSHQIVKNKLQRIRIKRGVRETFNGLMPVNKDTLDKGAFNHYSTVPACEACFKVYTDISAAESKLIAVEKVIEQEEQAKPKVVAVHRKRLTSLPLAPQIATVDKTKDRTPQSRRANMNSRCFSVINSHRLRRNSSHSSYASNSHQELNQQLQLQQEYFSLQNEGEDTKCQLDITTQEVGLSNETYQLQSLVALRRRRCTSLKEPSSQGATNSNDSDSASSALEAADHYNYKLTASQLLLRQIRDIEAEMEDIDDVNHEESQQQQQRYKQHLHHDRHETDESDKAEEVQVSSTIDTQIHRTRSSSVSLASSHSQSVHMNGVMKLPPKPIRSQQQNQVNNLIRISIPRPVKYETQQQVKRTESTNENHHHHHLHSQRSRDSRNSKISTVRPMSETCATSQGSRASLNSLKFI